MSVTAATKLLYYQSLWGTEEKHEKPSQNKQYGQDLRIWARHLPNIRPPIIEKSCSVWGLSMKTISSFLSQFTKWDCLLHKLYSVKCRMSVNDELRRIWTPYAPIPYCKSWVKWLQWTLSQYKGLQCRECKAQLAYLPPCGHRIPREVQLLHIAVVVRACLHVRLITQLHITIVVKAEMQLLQTATACLILSPRRSELVKLVSHF